MLGTLIAEDNETVAFTCDHYIPDKAWNTHKCIKAAHKYDDYLTGITPTVLKQDTDI